jgi:site-specific DNA recombinase
MISCVLYLRQSDLRGDDDLGGRERQLRARAAELRWPVERVIIENDLTKDGRRKGVSAWKRRKIVTPSGRTELRVIRPGFREVLDEVTAGRCVLAEDQARLVRDMRDGEDLLDALEVRGTSARSLSGTLNLTDGGTGTERMAFRMFLSHLAQESADKAWRVGQSRERLAEKGTSGKGQYGGGSRRPFGYMPDPFAEKYGKTLILLELEAKVIRWAARQVLAGVTLKSLARDLRRWGIPTVTGAAWAADTLRGCLLKPAVAGLSAHTKVIKVNGEEPRKVTTLHEAAWPAILDRDLWQAVVDKLTDPSRTTNPGSEPRWLVSGIARCHCGETVYTRTSGGRPSYVCRGPQQHLRRNAKLTDEHVGWVICDFLNREDNRGVLLPAPRAGIDTAALSAEARQLRERKTAQMRMHAAGDLDDADLAAGMKEIKRRLTMITTTLAETSAPDPLKEFRGRDAFEVWAHELTLPRKRAVLALLMEVTLLPAPRGRGFHDASVRIIRRRRS